MIQITRLSKRYGRRQVLQDFSVTLRPGEIALLLGANGVGKSTLLRCVLGVIEYEGRIRVGGLDPLAAGPAVRSLIGYMPQSGGLHLDLTVAETMALYADIRRVSHDRIGPLLAEAGLAGETSTRVGDLSGGMRQRLGFALALLSDPPVLVLDEPSASLDARSRHWLADRLRAEAAAGRTILVSTHADHELFGENARRIALDDDGAAATGDAGPASVPVTGSPAGTLRSTAFPLLRKELRDSLRNRWLIGYTVLMGALGLAATASGYDSVSGLGLQAFGRTTATLMNLCLLLAPLVAVLLGAASVAGERERGTLEHLLALPLSRTELLIAKHSGLLLALTAATVAGFLPAGLVIAAASGPDGLAHYFLFPALASLAVAALAGIGVFISVSSGSAVQAQGAAIVTWFAFALLYDLVLIGSLAVSGVAPEWLAASLLANPIDAARVLGVLALEPDLYLLGPAGAYLSSRFSPFVTAALLIGAIAAWAVLPVAAAAIRFSLPLRRKGRHETNRICAAPGHERPGRSHRLRVRRGIAGI
jgi:ABC-type Mn2+/Zn2+ transport system ATPase subunit/ABC-type transport system involved in multi-copper enzyme maturation permease subunit